jgi:leucine dehydrogenase
MTDHANIHSDKLYQLLWQQATASGFGRFHIKADPETGLFAIIALHSTRLGPALGGCRMVPYNSFADAFHDAMRLARSMSYKSALAGLALGGGKSVIVKPSAIVDRQKLMQAYGELINELNGSYITAVDSGTDVTDMDYIASKTPYVATQGSIHGDPSPYTAWGSVYGIEAAVKHHLGRDNIQGLTVVMQGAGNVGKQLARILRNKGANIIVSDLDVAKAKAVAEEVGGTIVAPEHIFEIEADIFAPAALGGVIHHDNVELIKTPIVAGPVNNVLTDYATGKRLFERGVLCAPDYVINGGGLMFAADSYFGVPTQKTWARVRTIYDTLLQIFRQASATARTPHVIADEMAEAVLQGTTDISDKAQQLSSAD